MGKSKYFANVGVERNKRPLQNIVYFITDRDCHGNQVYCLYWAYERDLNSSGGTDGRGGGMNFHGGVTEEQIRARLTPKQWSKFRQGERNFVKQRRVDGRNVKKKPAPAPVAVPENPEP
jgi:hypothetical protein